MEVTVSMPSRSASNGLTPPLSPNRTSTIRPPPTPISALNRSFTVMGNSFQSGSPFGSIYQDGFTVGHRSSSDGPRRCPEFPDGIDPLERPTSPYSAGMSFYQAYQSTPCLGSFGNELDIQPSEHEENAKGTNRKSHRGWRRIFKSMKCKGNPELIALPTTPSECQYPLETDPFSDYIGRPPSPPPSAPTIGSSDTLVGSTRSPRRPKVLRKFHRPPPIEVPMTPYEVKVFNPGSPVTASDVPPGFSRVPIHQPRESWDSMEACAAKRNTHPEAEEDAAHWDPVFFVIDPEWDPEDDESICFKFIDPPSALFVRGHTRGGSEGSNAYRRQPVMPQRARAMTHLGVVEPGPVSFLRRISEQMDEEQLLLKA